MHAHTDPTEKKGLRRKSRPTALAQCSPLGSTVLLKMEMMSLCQGHMAVSAAAPRGRELDPQHFLPSPPSLTTGDEGLWMEGEWTEERDTGVAVGARIGHCCRSGAKPAGEKRKTSGGHRDKLFSNTQVYKPPAKLLPQIPVPPQRTSLFYLPVRFGPTPSWYWRIQPSINTDGSARAGEGWLGAPLSPSVHGMSPPSLGPSTAKQSAALSWDIPELQMTHPQDVVGHAHLPPPGKAVQGGVGEGQHGGMQCSPLWLPSSSCAPRLTRYLHPEPNSHCNWEKPHPLSTGWVFLLIWQRPACQPMSLSLKDMPDHREAGSPHPPATGGRCCGQAEPCWDNSTDSFPFLFFV